MIEDSLEVVNPGGLHARTAKELVEIAERYDSTIELLNGDVEVDATSIMGVMMLAASPGTVIDVRIDGSDEKDAHEELANFFEEGFYENEPDV